MRLEPNEASGSPLLCARSVGVDRASPAGLSIRDAGAVVVKLGMTMQRYFPHGGTQRDLFAIAQACVHSGHDVRIFAESWKGAEPHGCEVELVPVRARFEALRAYRFALAAGARVAEWQADLVLGFDLMAGLDLYFAAEPCYRSKLEAAVFDPQS